MKQGRRLFGIDQQRSQFLSPRFEACHPVLQLARRNATKNGVDRPVEVAVDALEFLLTGNEIGAAFHA
nr:hypothetical protein [Gluconacetobacter diazotrophicus]